MKLGKHVSDSQTMSTSSPQGCALSPYSSPCTPTAAPPVISPSSSWSLWMTPSLLDCGGDESTYRGEIDHLVTWFQTEELNAPKTVEMIVDFRKNPAVSPCVTPHLTLQSSAASWEPSSPRTSSETKKALQRMYFLRQQKFNLSKSIMVALYTATTESILTSSITMVCCCHCWGQGHTAAYNSLFCTLPSLQDPPVRIQNPEACRKDCDRPLSLQTQTFWDIPLRQKTAAHQVHNLMP